MNTLLIEKIEENEDNINKLLLMDSKVMGAYYTYNDLVSIINEIDFNKTKQIFLEKDSLVLASLNLRELIKFYLLINPEENIYFYTNYEWLGIASLMSTLFSICYHKQIFLSKDKNYNIYYNKQDNFNNIYIYGEKIVFQEMSKDFPKAIWIDSTK